MVSATSSMKIELKRVHDFCVKDAAAVFNDDVIETLSKGS